MNSTRLSAAFCAVVLASSIAHAVVIKTVLVGNAGNSPDTEVMVQDGTTGYGAVPYEYRIGKYEVTKAQYTEFLNAVNPAGEGGPYPCAHKFCLYQSWMSTGNNAVGGGIDFDASAPNGSKYSVSPDYENFPANYVTWFDAVRFANWMHNGQGSGDTATGAYTLAPLSAVGSDPIDFGKNITRNQGARWFLPNEDEWYKAAYHKNDGVTGNYWDYPTGSDTPPTAEAPPGGTNSANFSNVVANFTAVGSYPLSPGPYGTFDQGGNAAEWNEALIIKPHHLFPEVDVYYRGTRGDRFYQSPSGPEFLAASWRPTAGCDGGNPGCSVLSKGFRMATLATVVPEPGTLLLVLIGAIIAILTRR